MKPTLIVCAAALLVGGCATFEPQAVSPAEQAARLESRTLDSPQLRAFIERNAVQPLEAWPPPQWDLDLLTLAALYYHPDLDVARAKWGVAQAGAVTAGMRPNPSLGFSALHNPGSLVGMSPWTLGLSLDIPIETAGKRGYRIQQANHLSEAARLAIASTAWQVRSRVRTAMGDWQVAQQTGEALLRQQRLQADNVTLLEHRLSAGAASNPEVTQARIALNQSTLAVGEARRLQADARARLAAALGLSAKALDGVGIAPATASEPAVVTAKEAREALLHRADVLGALAEYAASQSALQLEIANQYPDIHLGPGYTWDQGANKWSLGLTVTLPLMNQNEGPIAEAKAKRLQAVAVFNATQARALAELDAAFANYEASRQTLSAADSLAVAQTDQLRKARSSFAAGEIDRGVLLGTQLEMAQLELTRIDAAAKAQQALAGLEDATQWPLLTPALRHVETVQNNPRPTEEQNP